MKIFITGGTGFIGKATLNILAKSSHKILVLSRNPGQSVKNVSYLKGNFAEKRWKKKVKTFRPDVAMHLAWQDIPKYDFSTSAKNLKSSLDLFKFLYEIGCKKIVFSGTCWEYGTTSGKKNEEMFAKPAGAFGAAKLALTLLGEAFAKETNRVFISARLFFVFGLGQKPSSLIPAAVAALKSGGDPEIKKPDAANDFVHVNDAAKALVLLLTQDVAGGVYNIGSGKLTAVADIMNKLYRHHKRNLKLPVPDLSRPDAGFYADISKIIKATGWRPKTSVEKGIKEILANA